MLRVDNEGDTSGKKDILKGIRPPASGASVSIVAKDIQVRLLGDTGIVSSLKTRKWDSNHHPQSDEYRESNTYARKDGRWQLIASERAHAAPPYVAKDVLLNLKIDAEQLRGNKAATVVIVEFSDYQCPFCREFASRTMKQIEQSYIDGGRVGLVSRDYPLESMHPFAFKAAEAARCAASQGHFWEMNEALLQEPMALAQEDLLASARALKLDMQRFEQCLSDEQTGADLRRSMAEAESLGVAGTPIFFIGVRKPNDNSVTL